jgi:hypothetical protein
VATRTYTFEENLYRALRFARSAQARDPSRERALVVTKLEEAALWNDAVRVANDLPALGLHYDPA